MALLTSGAGQTGQLWRRSETGSGSSFVLAKTLVGHTSEVSCGAYSPDGRWLATADYEGTARIWAPDGEGGSVRSLLGHGGEIKAVAFSPDSSLLATVSVDSTAKVWRVDDGVCLHTLSGDGDSLLSLAFSPDGSLVLTACAGGTVCLWQTDDGARDPSSLVLLRVLSRPSSALVGRCGLHSARFETEQGKGGEGVQRHMLLLLLLLLLSLLLLLLLSLLLLLLLLVVVVFVFVVVVVVVVVTAWAPRLALPDAAGPRGRRALGHVLPLSPPRRPLFRT